MSDGRVLDGHVRDGHVRAWLEIMRISNLPTVLSNAIAGAALGLIVSSHDDSPRALFTLLSPPLAYLGGMVLNDAFDAPTDHRERPHRPIPSGRIARKHAFAAGFALLTLALAVAAVSSSLPALTATAALVACIVFYDAIHQRAAASTLLLAFCRALAAIVPMLAFAGNDWPTALSGGALVLPLALAAWTLGLSIVARGEMTAAARTTSDPTRANPEQLRRRFISIGGFVAASIIFLAMDGLIRRGGVCAQLQFVEFAPDAMVSMSVVVSIVMVALTMTLALVSNRGFRIIWNDQRATPSAIGLWIACLALIDAIALAATGQLLLAGISVLLACTTRRMQRQIAGS